ncbi:hypothetical protein JCM8547_006988 [Rhodosporidiobolus lusitaniae]
MLGRLPPELLIHIFELALPPIETVSEYDKRERTLTSLSLVSRQYRDIAQLLLWRIFRPKKDHLHLSASFPRLSAYQGSASSGNILPEPQSPFTTCDHYNPTTARRELVELVGLGSQLDMLQVALQMYRNFPSDLPDSDVPVLLAFSLDWTGFLSIAHVSRFQHFQLDAWEDSRYKVPARSQRLEKDLRQLVDAVANLEQIKSLSLPFQFHPSSSSFLRPDQHTIRDNLLSTCTSRKVDVIWRMNSEKPVDDETVSKDFWRYAKELKRQKAVDTEGSSASGSA